MKTTDKAAMKKATARLKRALRQADSACADMEIAAHHSINKKNVPTPWRVRSIAKNTRRAVELAQCIALDAPHEINQVET